jgi:RNA recognition motif-containing protein
MRLYVGNLSFNTDEQQLEQLFTPIGEVASVRLIRDHATGQSRGFGFVEMADSAQGRAACEKLERRVSVRLAQRKPHQGQEQSWPFSVAALEVDSGSSGPYHLATLQFQGTNA